MDMAFEFTPTTYLRSHAQNFNPLWRWYDGVPVGYSVLITGGSATATPGTVSPTQSDIDAADTGSGLGGKAAFLGGRTYTVTAGEKSILEAAGYTVVTT